MAQLLGGFGGLGGRAPSSPGFDDSRMDTATRAALIGRTPGAHAADRIAEEARRLRAGSPAQVGTAVSGGRVAPVPAVAALLGVVALLVIVLV